MTLPLRMHAHANGAMRVARFLESHSAVKRVIYPGLPSHEGHALAKRHMRGFGGVVSIDLGDRTRARRFLKRLELAMLAESLGGVETLASHPASMSHAWMDARHRRRLGVTPGLVRLSIGIEHPDDLIADFDQALGA